MKVVSIDSWEKMIFPILLNYLVSTWENGNVKDLWWATSDDMPVCRFMKNLVNPWNTIILSHSCIQTEFDCTKQSNVSCLYWITLVQLEKESFYANQISKSYLELIVPIDEMRLEVWVVECPSLQIKAYKVWLLTKFSLVNKDQEPFLDLENYKMHHSFKRLQSHSQILLWDKLYKWMKFRTVRALCGSGHPAKITPRTHCITLKEMKNNPKAAKKKKTPAEIYTTVHV